MSIQTSHAPTPEMPRTLEDFRSVTITEAATRTNLSYDFLWRLCKSGKLRYFRESPRGTYRILESEIVRVLSRELQGGVKTAAAAGPVRSAIADAMPRERKFA